MKHLKGFNESTNKTMISFHISASKIHKNFFGKDCIISNGNVDSLITEYSRLFEMEREGGIARDIYGGMVKQLKTFKLFFVDGVTYTCEVVDNNYIIQDYDDGSCIIGGHCSSRGKIDSRQIKEFLSTSSVGDTKKINNFLFEIV